MADETPDVTERERSEAPTPKLSGKEERARRDLARLLTVAKQRGIDIDKELKARS